MVLDTPARVDANTIWLHTRSAVTSAQYPRRVAYTIAISGLDGAVDSVNHYRASWSADGPIHVFPISDEELAAPPSVPHGVNLYFSVSLSEGRGAPAVVKVKAGHPAPIADLLGEPLLSPAYMFGLNYRVPMTPRSETPSSLKTIAIVSAQTPEYRVTLIDMPTVYGLPTYHLELTPLRNPKENRLRDLWVRTIDYLPVKALVAGNFTIAPLVDVPWMIDFTTIDGAPYIARESAESTLYLAHRRVVRHAVIAFDNVRESNGGIYDEPLVTPEATETTTTLTEPGP